MKICILDLSPVYILNVQESVVTVINGDIRCLGSYSSERLGLLELVEEVESLHSQPLESARDSELNDLAPYLVPTR